MPSEALLTLEDVACARGGLPVLSGVTFSVAPGEAVVLRGPNGSGKTTLLRTVAGLQPPLAGRIGGAEPAYAGHADGIKGALSVRENLAFWAAMFGTNTGTGSVEPALRAFDLWALRGRAAAHLSAGQKRRLGLARLAVTGRRLWLLDEPTVSLDTASVARFGAALAGHLSAGGAALIATHIDLGFAARIEDIARFRARADVLDKDFNGGWA